MYIDQSSGTSGTELDLSTIRRNHGLSLRDIADRTKIGTPYLRAIENEQFEALPGLVYSVSYIRQYASAIDYDAGPILDLYRKATSAPIAAEADPGPLPDPLLSAVRLRGGQCWRAIAGFVMGSF